MTAAETEQLLALLKKFIRNEVREALAERPAPPDDEELLGATEAAKLCGWPSRRAMDQQFHRDRAKGSPHSVELLALDVNGLRKWKRGSLIDWCRAQGRRRR